VAFCISSPNSSEVIVTKENVLAAIRVAARKLGRIPTRRELRQMAGISEKVVSNRFGTFGKAIRAAGFEPVGPGYQTSTAILLKDWARVARKLGKLPTKDEYSANSRHSPTPFDARWKSWLEVGFAFEKHVKQTGAEAEWADVLALVRKKYPRLHEEEESAMTERREAGRPATEGAFERRALRRTNDAFKRPLMPGRPVYGPRLHLPGLAHEPVSENGVIHLFGMFGHELGFTVLRIQQGFPDCIALREVQPGKLQMVNIEFELESRNFLKHAHEIDGADLIVCWAHNWKDCPIEVVELRRIAESARHRA
jgi:HNH endonuclease